LAGLDYGANDEDRKVKQAKLRSALTAAHRQWARQIISSHVTLIATGRR
jgi:hypothetical protein